MNSKQYKDILFLTISIDQKSDQDKWLKAIKGNNMTRNVKSYFGPTGDSHFETDSQINGVPRYFIIDKEGKIINRLRPQSWKRNESINPKYIKTIIMNASF